MRAIQGQLMRVAYPKEKLVPVQNFLLIINDDQGRTEDELREAISKVLEDVGWDIALEDTPFDLND